MLIEIHMLQNHAPSNLNRDDSGSPKDCIFGGIRRARISSQCLKRSIRRSPIFIDELGEDLLGIRTRRLPQEIKAMLLAKGVSEELAEIAAEKVTGFGNKEGKEQKDGKTAQVIFLSPQDIQKVAEVMYEVVQNTASAEELKNLKAKELQSKATLKGWRPITLDIALFGRMTTSDAFRDVEAAMQVAHAISTNKMDHEFDYFTAVDDLQESEAGGEDTGAGMIGDVEFNSACFYKYISLDFDGLVANMAGPKPKQMTNQEKKEYEDAYSEARLIAIKAVKAFLKAAIFTNPSGKQNSFAAHQLPESILVEVRSVKAPVSYANAFIKPAKAYRDKDLLEDSMDKFIQYAEKLNKKYNLESIERLWFNTRDIEMNDVKVCETTDDLFNNLQIILETSEDHE